MLCHTIVEWNLVVLLLIVVILLRMAWLPSLVYIVIWGLHQNRKILPLLLILLPFYNIIGPNMVLVKLSRLFWTDLQNHMYIIYLDYKNVLFFFGRAGIL